MKLLVIAPYFYPKIGGMEKYAYNISKGLKKQYNWEVVIVTSNHEENKFKKEFLDGMTIYKLPILFKLSNTPINPLWYFKIKSIIKTEKPDVINAQSPVPFIADITALVKKDIPMIVTYHAGSLIKDKFIPDLIIKPYEKYFLNILFNKAEKIIYYSPDYFKKKLKLWKEKTIYIPPGVDLNIFKPSKRIPTTDLLYVGRIEKNADWKGIQYLLDALTIILKTKPDIKLTLVGSGDRVDYFKKYSLKLGIDKNVIFAGTKHGKDLAIEYQKSKILILPSITNSEAFGIVLIEAMACKIPVIGSNIGGIPYVIDHGETGLLSPPKDILELSRSILKILSNDILLNKLAENGYKKVIKHFKWDYQINETHKILTSLL